MYVSPTGDAFKKGLYKIIIIIIMFLFLDF